MADRAMGNEKLLRDLWSVGMACYVAYHQEFSDFGKSDAELIDLLVETEGYKRSSSITKVLGARRIISSGQDRDALEMISTASRVAPAVAEQALQLLGERATLKGNSVQALPRSARDTDVESPIK